MAISINELANEITDTLKEYTKEVEEGLEEVKEETAKDGAKTLKDTSPSGHRKSKKYRQGWRAKKDGTAWVVHNVTNYQLTHLLEKGHALWQGGRSPAIPHIAPVEEQLIKEYEKKVEKVIKG